MSTEVSGEPNKGQLVEAVVAEVQRDRMDGADVCDADVIERHPELAPELEEALVRMARVRAARDAANHRAEPSDSDGGSHSERSPNPSELRGFSIFRDLTRERRVRIANVLEIALECDPVEQCDVLARECAGNDDMQREVESVLEMGLERARAFIQETRQESLSTPHIDGYEIIAYLGHGGMGVVYVAIQTKLNRKVALKILPPMLSSVSPDVVERFRREAMAAARLHHTNIIPIYDFGQTKDTHYYAMELVEGESLDKLIRRLNEEQAGPVGASRLRTLLSTSGVAVDVSWKKDIAASLDHSPAAEDSVSATSRQTQLYFRLVAGWMADVADALHHAHTESIIHRDIKPSNIILASTGRVMVGDFGLAKVEDDTSITLTGSLIGTPRYLSPEQAMAQRIPVDRRTDIYSLGATMYELLTLTPAFPGTDRQKILAAIIQKEPVAPAKILPAVPRDLETICQKALEKDPETRYDTARDMADDIRRFLQDVPIVAQRPGLGRRVAKFYRRHRPVVLLALALLVTIVTSLGVWRHLTLAQDKKDAFELSKEGDRAFGNDEYDQALDYYRQASTLDPGNQVYLSKESNALFSIADDLRIKRDLEGARAKLIESQAICDPILAAHANDDAELRCLRNQGVLLKREKEYASARRVYERGINIAAKTPSLKVHLPSFRNNWAQTYALAFDMPNAVHYLKAAIDVGVDCERTMWSRASLAAVQLAMNDNAAGETIRLGLACDPSEQSVDIRQNEAELHALEARRLLLTATGRDDLEQARTEVEQAFVLSNAPNERILRLEAYVYARLDLRKRAMEVAAQAKAASVAKGDDPANTVLPDLIIAYVLAQDGDLDAARTLLEQATSKDRWPSEFDGRHDFFARSPKGRLWFEYRADYDWLRAAVEKRLGESP